MEKSNDVAYQNKDIASKVFADNFKGKPLNVYGLDLPPVKQVLPTNLPEIAANELRIDNLFLLEDGTVAIIDYESTYNRKNHIKYINYLVRVLERYYRDGIYDIRLRMVVIYTADVKPESVPDTCRTGALTLHMQQAFLSQLDSEGIMSNLTDKVQKGERLSEEEVMEFIILPLTYKTKEAKQTALKQAIELAKDIPEKETMMFVLSGILVFSDKIIDAETSRRVKEWIRMTQVGRLFEQEKLEYAREEALKAAKKEAKEIAKNMLKAGKISVEDIAAYCTALTVEDVRKIEEELLQKV